MKCSPGSPGGTLTSMPTWPNTERCSATSAFFFAGVSAVKMADIIVKHGLPSAVTFTAAELTESRIPMSDSVRAIAFDVDQASLISLRKALPDSVIEEVNGATAASLTRDWDPGTVDLLVVGAREKLNETLDLCRFLVSSGVLARDSQEATDSQEELPKTLGLHRSRHNRARRPPSPLLVLVPPGARALLRPC